MRGREHLKSHETEVAKDVATSVWWGRLLEEYVGSFAVEALLCMLKKRDETRRERRGGRLRVREGSRGGGGTPREGVKVGKTERKERG